MLHRRARLPRADGRPPRAIRTSPPRRRFGVQWLLRMWNDRTRTLYYQVGIGDGNAKTISDHDIWRLPQADDHYGGHDPLLPLHPPPSGVPRRAARVAGQPQPRRPRRRRVRPLLPGVPATADRRLAARCLRAGEHIFALANTHPAGPPADRDPVGLLSGDASGATTSSSARSSSPMRSAIGGQLPAGLPHRSPLYYLRPGGSLGPTPTSPHAAHRRHPQPL